MALYSAKADSAGTYRFSSRRWRRGPTVAGLWKSGCDPRSRTARSMWYSNLSSTCDSWRIAGCEALVRWTSPEWGVVSPAEFIPVAEATGLIEPIGEWVLREAVNTARQWPDDTVVAVNLSPVQFKNQKFLATVVSALAESGLPPRRLELEVTESIFLDGGDHTGDVEKSARARYSHHARRFRHRLFVVELSAAIPVRQDQDRQIVHRRCGGARREPGDHPSDRRARQRARHVDDRGGRGIPASSPSCATPAVPKSRATCLTATSGARKRRHVRVEAEGRENDSVTASARASDPRARITKRRVNGEGPPVGAQVQPWRLSDCIESSASFGLAFLCTTALTAAIIAFGASDWKMLRHVDAGGALLHGAVGHGEGVEFGQLLAAGHHDRHRAGGGDGFEAVVDVIGLDVLRAEFGDDAAGEAEILRVAHHVLADRRDAHHRHAAA